MQPGKATNASGTVHMEILSEGGCRAVAGATKGAGEHYLCKGVGGEGRYGIVAHGWFVPTVLLYQREC